MPIRTLGLTLFIGAALALGAAALPIDPGAAERLTTERLVRGQLSALRPAEGQPAVRLILAGPGTAGLATLIDQPVARPTGEARPAFLRVNDAAAPALEITSQRVGAQLTVTGRLGEARFEASARVGDWRSLLPPLLAILLAITLRRVVPALLGAVLLGATLLHGGNPLAALWDELTGLALAPITFVRGSPSLDGYLGRVLADAFNLQILAFTFALVGLVALVSRMGGTQGLVQRLSPLARGPRSAQAVTGLMGTALFFDDYANTVVIGATGRSLTDRHRLSREKLAYIVDSTSAPVAGVAIVSTWIGYEVGLFDDLLPTLAGLAGMPTSGYALFFEILPLRFYCFFALSLVFLGALTGRDLGPMRAAESRVRRGGPVSPGKTADAPVTELTAPGITPRARNAILPIGAVLLATSLWIITAGSAELETFSLTSAADWKAVFAAPAVADHTAEILLGSALIGSAVAFALALLPRLLSLREALTAYLSGLSTLAEAAAVLILAWAIKAVCDDLGTGLALVALIGDGLPVLLLPLVIFLLSGVVAFATGTSWGTMALVLPVAAPLAANLGAEPLIVFACLGAVLDGAIWGDHCSPISDTTVLSSTASGCPHLAHVRTQLPYASLAMLAAGGAGYVGVTAGLPLWAAYPAGLGVMLLGLYTLGAPPSLGPPIQENRRGENQAP